MRAGDLRHRVTFQSRSRVSDGMGGNAITWGSDVTVWANVKPLSGRELSIADQIGSVVSHKVTIRSNAATVDHNMRMVFNGKNYNVRWSRDIEERGRWTEIYVDLDRPT